MFSNILPRVQRLRWRSIVTCTLALVAATVGIVGSQHMALAHGALSYPATRAFACYLQGPENPSNAACRAAKDLNGSQQFYDWSWVSHNTGQGPVEDAIGPNNPYVRDGYICSADRPDGHFRGLDLARNDWPATSLPSGATMTLTYEVTVGHTGVLQLYTTNSNYNPNLPLTWSDLDLAHPLVTYPAPPDHFRGEYEIPDVALPHLSGRQLILSVWKRVHDPAGETFYGCSDVVFS